MTTHFNEIRPYILVGPGDYIDEQLEVRGWTQEDFADIIGVSIQTVNKLIKNKSQITHDISVLLAKAFDQTPQYWLNLDSLYRIQSSDFLVKGKEVEIRKEIYTRMPINEMNKRGWLEKGETLEELKSSVLKFWKWTALDFSNLDKTIRPSFKKSEALSKNFNSFYAMCWFQMAKNVASTISAPIYCQDKLQVLYSEIASFSARENGITDFLSKLHLCGVKFFVLGHLKNTYIDGAAFMDNKNPVIVYTSRYKRLDNFWFTLAHEIAHILCHLKSSPEMWFVDMANNDINKQEIEANELAQKMLKHDEIKMFFTNKMEYIPSQQIKICADELNIHPCLVVGALAYLKKTYHNRLHEFGEDPLCKIPEKYLIDKQLLKTSEQK